MKLIENLYAYVWQGNDNNCNTYLIANAAENRHIIVDPGHIRTPFYREPGLENLNKQIQADGLNLADIGLVLLTHGHPDHVEAAVPIRDKSKARIAIHSADENMAGIRPIDISLTEGELKLESGKSTGLQIYHSPGHSAGHVTVYLPLLKALIAGDVIFYQNIGRTDLPGGSAFTLQKSIEKLSKLDVEYLLCGHPYGHPGVITGKKEVQANFAFVLENIFY
jgi:hydroxyacylglutathione hydrolase